MRTWVYIWWADDCGPGRSNKPRVRYRRCQNAFTLITYNWQKKVHSWYVGGDHSPNKECNKSAHKPHIDWLIPTFWMDGCQKLKFSGLVRCRLCCLSGVEYLAVEVVFHCFTVAKTASIFWFTSGHCPLRHSVVVLCCTYRIIFECSLSYC